MTPCKSPLDFGTRPHAPVGAIRTDDLRFTAGLRCERGRNNTLVKDRTPQKPHPIPRQNYITKVWESPALSKVHILISFTSYNIVLNNSSISAIRYDFRGMSFALALDFPTNQYWQSNGPQSPSAEWFCAVPFEWRAQTGICGPSQQVSWRGTAQCSGHGVFGEL